MMEASMKNHSANSTIPAFAVTLTLALLVMGVPVRGQAPTVPVQPKINISLEQRHVIKEILKDLNISPAQQNTETTVGTTVPPTIALSPMPGLISEKVPQIKSHMLFVKEGKVVIVDPKDNKIVDAID
jgi:hypothetical protein